MTESELFDCLPNELNAEAETAAGVFATAKSNGDGSVTVQLEGYEARMCSIDNIVAAMYFIAPLSRWTQK